MLADDLSFSQNMDSDPDLEPIDPSVFDGHDPLQTRWKASTEHGGYIFIAFRPPPPPPPQTESVAEDTDFNDELEDDADFDLALPELKTQKPSHTISHGLITPPPSPPLEAQEKKSTNVSVGPPSPPEGIVQRFSMSFMRSQSPARSKSVGTAALMSSTSSMTLFAPLMSLAIAKARDRDEWRDDPDIKPRTISGKIRWEDDRDSWF